MSDRALKAVIIVAALGYFVDVYDLILFSVVRVASLKSLGLSSDQILSHGVFLINMQMAGMLCGGIVWGVLGDKRGRISVLFGSIIIYSVANIANAFVETVGSYAAWRFIAGFGLAGELGAGVTLVTELMPREKRGYGTTIIATVGVLGAVLAATTGTYLDWRLNYLIGGFLGICLLGLRMAVRESGLFAELQRKPVARGSLSLLITSRARMIRYLLCVLTGVPIWTVVGVIVTFAPEIAEGQGVVGSVTAAKAVLYCYIGLCAGDLASGLFSQYLRSRKLVLYIFMTLTWISSAIVLTVGGISASTYHLLFLPLGFAIGYWAIFVTIAAEQFGTNLRATVATSVPNFVRGAAVPMTSLFHLLLPSLGVIGSAGTAVSLSLVLALISAGLLKESFSYDLDFIEQ